MNPQPRTKSEYDSRNERIISAHKTGQYRTFPGGGGIPIERVNGKIRALPGFLAAEKRRRAQMMGRMEIEHNEAHNQEL